MFTHAQLSIVARAAHALTDGSGAGFTQYATYAPRARYVIGGYLPSRMYPISESVARIKADALKDSRTPLGLSAQTLGCWEDNGTVYVDFGTVTDDYEFAIQLARKRGELAIYDTVTNSCISVPRVDSAESMEDYELVCAAIWNADPSIPASDKFYA